MTIYIPNLENNTKLSVNGNLGGYQTYYLALYSRYTNKTIGTEPWFVTAKWAPELFLQNNNDRYTEFSIASTFILAFDAAGIYDYTIWGSELDLNPQIDPFEPEEWVKLQDGLAKLHTNSSATKNLSSNTTYDVVRHETPNDNTESYVIYQ